MATYCYSLGTVDTTGWSGIYPGDQKAAQMVLVNQAGSAVSVTPFYDGNLLTAKVISATGNDISRRVPPNATTVIVSIQSTAISGTPSMVFKVDWSQDGTVWGQSDSFTAITATGVFASQSLPVKGRYFRISWVLSSTTSLTVNVTTTFLPQPGL